MSSFSDTNILLNSAQGQQLLKESQNAGFCQNNLIQVFGKQIGRANCGIQSMTMLLNAHHLGAASATAASKHSLPYHEQSFFDDDAIKSLKTQTAVDKEGTDVAELAAMLSALGYQAEAHETRMPKTHPHPVEVDEEPLHTFREQVKHVLKHTNSGKGMIMNYCMQTAGQNTGLGHHSPLAAYHPQTDHCLILDCWPATEEFWVPTERLFRAINTADNVTPSKRRGYILLQGQK